MAMVADNVPHARIGSWLLRRRLYRNPASDSAADLAKVLALRVCAAACAFGSMVLTVWIAAFVRLVFLHGWHGFWTLNYAHLSRTWNPLTQAATTEGDLVPVLMVWAVLLALTPTGYTLAFYAAEVAAGALGALRIGPPSFLITSDVAGFSHGFSVFDRHWNGGVLFFVSICAVYLLYRCALGAFGHLDELTIAPRRRSRLGSPARDRAAQLCGAVLALVVLLAAAWTAAVVKRLAAAPYVAGKYGLHAGQVQGRCLFILAVVAVLVALSRNPQRPLAAGIIAAMVLGWLDRVPHVLVISFGQGTLAHVGSAWGAACVWAALFLYFPVCALGPYLSAWLRPAREQRWF